MIVIGILFVVLLCISLLILTWLVRPLRMAPLRAIVRRRWKQASDAKDQGSSLAHPGIALPDQVSEWRLEPELACPTHAALF